MTPRKDLWQLQGTDVYLQSPRSKGFIADDETWDLLMAVPRGGVPGHHRQRGLQPGLPGAEMKKHAFDTMGGGHFRGPLEYFYSVEEVDLRVQRLRTELAELAEEIHRRENEEHGMGKTRRCSVCLKPSDAYATHYRVRACPTCWGDDPRLYPQVSLEALPRRTE